MEIFMSYKLRQVTSLRVLNEVSLDTTDIASVVCVCSTVSYPSSSFSFCTVHKHSFIIVGLFFLP